MTTPLEICQKATGLIGANKPEAFDDGSVEGEACDDAYEDLLLSVLSGRPWTFASRQVELIESAEESELGYSRVFIVPSDSIKVFHARTKIDYEIVGNKLHTNRTKVNLNYAFRPDETFLSKDFILALKYGIAAEINLPVTGNVSKTDLLTRKFKELLKNAAFTDGRSTPNNSVRNYRLLSVRRSGGRY